MRQANGEPYPAALTQKHAHAAPLTADEIRAIYFQLNALGLQQNSVYVGDVVALFAARYMP